MSVCLFEYIIGATGLNYVALVQILLCYLELSNLCLV